MRLLGCALLLQRLLALAWRAMKTLRQQLRAMPSAFLTILLHGGMDTAGLRLPQATGTGRLRAGLCVNRGLFPVAPGSLVRTAF